LTIFDWEILFHDFQSSIVNRKFNGGADEFNALFDGGLHGYMDSAGNISLLDSFAGKEASAGSGAAQAFAAKIKKFHKK
jgi:hypothetical protein